MLDSTDSVDSVSVRVLLSCVYPFQIELPFILRDLRYGGVPCLPNTCWCARLVAVLRCNVCNVGSNGPVHTSGGRVVQCASAYVCVCVCVFAYVHLREA